MDLAKISISKMLYQVEAWIKRKEQSMKSLAPILHFTFLFACTKLGYKSNVTTAWLDN